MRAAIWFGAIVVLGACNAVFGLHRTQPVDGPFDGPSVCPASYLHLSTGDYRVSTTPESFSSAEAACASDTMGMFTSRHTHLVVASSPTSPTEELNVIYNQVHPMMPTSSFWVGLSDRPTATSTQTFQWITDELLPALVNFQPPWPQGYPISPSAKNCAYLASLGGELLNGNCDVAIPFICECDDYAEDPSHY